MASLGAIYESLAGLMSFTKGLDSLSGNVANMNTTGYKGQDAIFSDVVDSTGKTNGVKVNGESIRFTQADLQDTGINTNMGIQGDGFFILRSGSEYLYTRAGKFSFDENGFLVDGTTGYKVQSLGQDNKLSDIQINQFGASLPIATSNITFSGNLYPLTTTGGVVPASGQVRLNLFDTNGNLETATIKFTKLDSTSLNFTPVPGDTSYWKVSVVPATGGTGVVASPLQNADIDQAGNIIAFDASGAISKNYNQLTLSYTFGNTAAQNHQITLNFGGAGTFSGVISDTNNSQSNIIIATDNGRAIGYTSESKVSIDKSGIIKAIYTNGDEVQLGQVALAQFVTNSSLIAVGNNFFRVDQGQKAILGYGSSGSFGDISSGKIEGSNVNLSSEFSEIIILQRGYQASSQVMNATNKMLEELYNSMKGG